MRDAKTSHAMTVGGIVAVLLGAAVLVLVAARGGEVSTAENSDLVFRPVGSTASTTTDSSDSVEPLISEPASHPAPKQQLRLSTTPGVERWYYNKKLTFSFRLPDGFLAPEIRTTIRDAQGVSVFDRQDNRLLVLALPVEAESALTPDDIRENSPGETITDIREGFVSAVVRGLSYRTDSPEWGGDGIGFWFLYNGYLYEVTTFRQDQALMDSVLQSFQFAHPRPPSKP